VILTQDKKLINKNDLELNGSNILYAPGTYEIFPLLRELNGYVKILISSPEYWKNTDIKLLAELLPELKVPPISGGFRLLTQLDLNLLSIRYDIENRLKADELEHLLSIKISNNLFKLIKNTKLFSRIKFLHLTSEENLVKLLSIIIDPRFFCINRVNTKKLYAYFGLRPGYKHRMSKNQRFMLAYLTWFDKHIAGWLDTSKHYRDLLEEPQYFLLKYWHITSLVYDDKQKAALKTTEKFLDFIFYNWLDYLYEKQNIFDAERFFKDKGLCDEYYKWRGTVTNN